MELEISHVDKLIDFMFTNGIGSLMSGGPKGIIMILVGIIGYLLWHQKRLVADIAKKDDRINSIIDDYNKGNMTISDALNQLKLVLVEIRVKL